MSSTESIYRTHHQHSREEDFVLLEKERGELFSALVGEGKRVLDLGCRDGALTRYFVENNRVTGVDVDSYALNRAQKKYDIKTIHMDLNGNWEELLGTQFDVITAGEVLEHLYYPEEVVKKIKRLLDSNGMFIGSVPNAFNAKNRVRLLLGRKKHTPLSDPTHINHFSHKELKALLEKHFAEVTLIPLGRFAWLDRFFPGWTSFSIAFVAKV